jgi:prepilin-type N-terminal cleavage/methylation domain-containing protein
MKTTSSINVRGAEQRASRAFTLIEIIGVLAVIAILATLLIPKVFNAINDAKLNNTIVSYETIKTAVTDHYGKYGALNSFFGTNTATTAQLAAFDTQVLLPEGLIDKPFTCKIGNVSAVHLVTGAGACAGQGYNLDGTNNAAASMTYVCEIVVSNVAAQDAFDVSTRIDGASLTPTSPGQDLQGRVGYYNTNLYLYVIGR